MSRNVKVAIGIQARSTSTRLPNKCMALIDGKPMLRHVLDACHQTADFINRNAFYKMAVQVVTLIPTGDPLGLWLKGEGELFYAGPEHDVLARYEALMMGDRYDYVCRVTGDCPLIPPYLITKHIKVCSQDRLDYCSNVDPKCRTEVDGRDCEVISRQAMAWLFKSVQLQCDREHVTSLLRTEPPSWLRTGHIIGFLDLAHQKLSVDTSEDLEAVRYQVESVKKKLELARGPNTTIYRH